MNRKFRSTRSVTPAVFVALLLLTAAPAYSRTPRGAIAPAAANPALHDVAWDHRFGLAGVNMPVNALARRGGEVIAGGGFIFDVVVGRFFGGWNGRRWSLLGDVRGPVYALAASGKDMYVGGWFGEVGGVPISSIARWDGSTWHPLGAGVRGSVIAIAVSGKDVYVAGSFNQAGGVAAANIARWDGSAWHPLGDGVRGGVSAITVSGKDVYVGGYFNSAGGVAAANIARWDGNAWHPLGGGVNNWVGALTVSGTNLYRRRERGQDRPLGRPSLAPAPRLQSCHIRRRSGNCDAGDGGVRRRALLVGGRRA
jgi:hypothetical protein